MADPRDDRSAREFTDRVFFNTVVILKGVVLAFGALVLLALLRRGAPWESGRLLSVYLAWATTMLVVTLSFVAQALGSSLNALHRPTLVMLLISILGIEEFILFGLLEPHEGESLPLTIRSWLLGFAITTGTSCLFLSVVLKQIQGETLGRLVRLWIQRQRKKIEARDKGEQEIFQTTEDFLAAGLTALVSLSLWGLLAIPGFRNDYSWAPVSFLGVLMIVGLVRQQGRVQPSNDRPKLRIR